MFKFLYIKFKYLPLMFKFLYIIFVEIMNNSKKYDG